MVQVSYPGVYVQEVPSGARAITGVATSIAAFVGMAQRGPVNQPIQVLSFADYERVFSSDTAAGEMTDQVRQFFLNGGQRAYIVRIAQGASESVVSLGSNGSGGAAFTLRSRGAGGDENQLRARIDYATNLPGSTFNLTLYRESFDSAGNATISEVETHKGLSLSENSPFFVTKVVNRDSKLVEVQGDVTPAAAGDGVSISGLVATNMTTTLSDTIGTRPFGAFTMSLEGHPTRTVQVTSGGSVQDAINVVLASLDAPPAVTADIVDAFGGQVIQIVADGTTVRLGSAGENDIAAALGLGVENGGYERGSLVDSRPTASGLLFADDLAAASAADRSAFFTGTPTITLSGADGFGPLSLEGFMFPDGNASDDMLEGTTPNRHLANLAENLGAIAAFINRSQSKWQASVEGFRLALRPLFGNYTTTAGTLTGPGYLAGASVSSPAAVNFASGASGSVAELTEYQEAFRVLDKEVDLFNLMILPRSKDDPDGIKRAEVWGPASSFCFEKRAFLLVDADPNLKAVSAVPDAVRQLRIGMKKDHAAFYWPRVQISSGGERKLIDPSGTIAGLMARTDASRGVWKAPAGVEAELLGTLGVETRMSDRENGTLNPEAINCIRTFPNGIISWGARTMDGFDNSGNLDYKYVPVRRLSLFIAESLQRGLKFAVFEPNDEPLWAQIRLAAGGFMNNLFRQGAFQGSTAREAYFVKVDRETTTQNDINLGIVNVAVGFAPLRPAEFVVVTLQQKAGQIQI